MSKSTTELEKYTEANFYPVVSTGTRGGREGKGKKK